MALTLGASGVMVAAWQKTMVRRFASYAKGSDGNTLRVDSKIGYDDQAVQREYQIRTGQAPTGVVGDHDLHRLGLMPTLFSVHGAGQPDPLGIGMPADAARRCLDLYRWQPVGNYPAATIPMDNSVNMGEAEIVRLINDRNVTPGPIAFFDYSEGSICAGRVRNRMRDGDLKHRYKDLIGAASWGNPMRPKGSYAGNVDPGGGGISPQRETATEPFCINLAHPGDLYTSIPDGAVGEMERAIFNAVFRDFTGEDTLTEQIWEILKNPFSEGAAALRAIWNGGMFFGAGTGPHVRYHLDLCSGTGLTYYEFAIHHIRAVAERRLLAIVNAPM